MLSAHRFFQLLSDPTRLRCLLLLHHQGELCVCELTYALGASQPKISRHLAALREAGLVGARRRGQWNYYHLHRELPEWARRVLEATAIGVTNTAIFAADRAVLAHMPNRPGARFPA